ncbi:MAG: alginate lyase family protein [Chloroflexi bacterium]|nr:alginate lyase family protein [Chloroflexota bacterium]
MTGNWARARAVPLRAVPRVAANLIGRRWHALTAPRAPRPLSDADFLHALRPLGDSGDADRSSRVTHRASRSTLDARLASVVEHFRGPDRPRLFHSSAEIVEASHPGARQRLIARAANVLAHRFDLLGSGPIDLGVPIEWRRDFKSGHAWALAHHTRLTLVDLRAGFDVKVAWELSRFHHGVALAQAWAATGSALYADEFAAQVKSWLAQNPPEFGPNWANAMEAAIRAANWLTAYDILAAAPSLSPEFHIAILKSLLSHGRYIASHLESGWPGSNHYLADLCGLVWLGALLPEFRESQRWLHIGLSGLVGELRHQVYDDGADYEASAGYHCLVTEMALWSVIVCRLRGVSIPPFILARLEKMLDVIAGLLKPDGTLPAFGDLDSGRWLALESDTDRLPSGQDPQGLLALGAVLFEHDDWAVAAGDRWEAAFWVKGLEATKEGGGGAVEQGGKGARGGASRVTRHSTPITSVTFPNAGWYVMRHGDRYLAFEAGDNGSDGWGLHAHNDALSFELAVGERGFLVDPGSYLYTGDFRARNAFRATAAHNTLIVDGAEINRIPELDMFRLGNDAKVNVIRWATDGARDFVEAEHTGFLRLGVRQRRQIHFDKRQGFWLVRDLIFEAAATRGRSSARADDRDARGGEHSIDIYFHFAPLPIVADGLAVRTACGSGVNLLILPLRKKWLTLSQHPGWVSPRYGVRVSAPVVRYSARAALPVEFAFALWPFEGEIVPDEVRTLTEPALRAITDSK